ncbi:hypothetical protein DPM35_29090 [Mesorhizobium atlanticum]|uniref:YjiS-like domain-containing protein n=1 Tax=Mesorhizobium atlanticum TaxID=2233532 RepID=A0A330GJ63_9HYPH|nr:hypothetical protein DPM35_29090 [Mesorhizobium atlanticum]
MAEAADVLVFVIVGEEFGQVRLAGSLVGWLGRRADQKAQLKATDELSELPDDMLSDIGISRDGSLSAGFGLPDEGT